MNRDFVRVIFIFLLSLSIVPSIATAGASKAVANGSFVQVSLCGSWTDARWQEEFVAMKDAGMHYLVIGPVAECTSVITPRNTVANDTTLTLYPSSLPNTKLDPSLHGNDMVDACLRNAESAGIKVFIGISTNNLWWHSHGADTTWLYSQMNFDNQVCDEVWSLYKNKYPDAFCGWYWAYEVDNASFASQAQQNELIHAMNIQLDHLSAANEKLPFMWCPFMNSSLGTPQEYQAMWEYVFPSLHTTDGDIFCPQDGLGGGGTTLSTVASWFSALRNAVNTKPGLLMWSDVETFGGNPSATLDRFISQLKLEQPYVDDYITFAYCHYYSPYVTDPGFQTTYIDYLNTGSLETTPPSAPRNFSALSNAGNIVLNWEASTDDIGVCGYSINRNGKEIGRLQVSVSDGGGSSLPTSFTDLSVSPNTKYIYAVRAYDFAGNFSDPSSDSVTTGNFNVVSVGRPYTISIQPSSSYPDPAGTKLTDGKFASIASYSDGAWVGFLNPDTLQVVIDLGKAMPVQQFVGEYLLDPQPAVYLPKQVMVATSTDDITFTGAGTLTDSEQNDTVSSIHKYVCSIDNPITARYVKFTTVASGAWTFIDEYEVLNFTPDAIRPPLSSARGNFQLSNNYPNPFNPTTMINYQLPMTSRVTIEIYNVLGQKVESRYKGIRGVGRYEDIVNMEKFTSGVYFYRVDAVGDDGGRFTAVKKLVLVK